MKKENKEESSSGSSSSGDEEIAFLATERERRRNAGAKMAQMLENEDCDDFYKSTYGGFFEEEEDAVFDSPVESETDEVDSDFDIDEKDEPISDHEEGEGAKKTRRVFTKAYKEPVRKQPGAVTKRPKPKPKFAEDKRTFLIERRLRERTRGDSTGYRRPPKRKIPRRLSKFAKLTQEQLLREAEGTERANLKSLERFVEMELEEKKKRGRMMKRKMAIPGPSIKYLSLALPHRVHHHPPTPTHPLITVDDMESPPSSPVLRDRKEPGLTSSEDPGFIETVGCNFLVFSNEEDIQLPRTKTPPFPPLCVVTGKPAKYRDPLTNCFYHDIPAFKTIRRAYETFLFGRGEQR